MLQKPYGAIIQTMQQKRYDKKGKELKKFNNGNFIQKLNTKWRPNSSLQKQSITNSIITASYTSSQVC